MTMDGSAAHPETRLGQVAVLRLGAGASLPSIVRTLNGALPGGPEAPTAIVLATSDGRLLPDDDAALGLREQRERMSALAEIGRVVREAPTVVVAAAAGELRGRTAEFLLSADLVVLADTATLAFDALHTGATPQLGASALLPHRVGASRAAGLVLSGHAVTASEALALGLVHEVVPGDRVEARARELAAQLDALPRRAVSLTKRLLREGPAMTPAALAMAEVELAAVAHSSRRATAEIETDRHVDRKDASR